MDRSLPIRHAIAALTLALVLPAPLALGAEWLPDRRGRTTTLFASPWESVTPLDREVTIYRKEVGTIWRVGAGGAYRTIQSAIDRASPGDVVLVAPGTYRENLVFPPQPVILIGEGGAETTIVDGRGCTKGVDTCSTLSITQDGSEGHWIEGLTIIGGQGTRLVEADLRAWDPYRDPALGGAPSLGGGIFSTQGGLTLMHCVIRGGEGDLGGGVALLGDHTQLMADLMMLSGLARRGGWSDDLDAQATGGPDLLLGETDIIANHSQQWGGASTWMGPGSSCKGVEYPGIRAPLGGGSLSGAERPS